MREFSYRVASNPSDALMAAGADARYLGGGTNLVDLMKLDVERPAELVDVTQLPLDQVELTDDGWLRIGAAVRNSELAAHPLVRQHFPGVSQALVSAASGQLRNLATTGGNLLQRTRCQYFMDVTKPCNKREPGTGCPARTGEHHNHAILGASEHCIATMPSDLAVPLAAFDAEVLVLDADGESSVPLAQFRRLPGDRPDLETSVAPNALVLGVALPPSPLAAGSVYRKVRERASYAFAIASVSAAISVRDGIVEDCRLAWGAVAATPWRAYLAEEHLRGLPAIPQIFAEAADLELELAEPLPQNAYKVELIRNLTVDVLSELAGVQA